MYSFLHPCILIIYYMNTYVNSARKNCFPVMICKIAKWILFYFIAHWFADTFRGLDPAWHFCGWKVFQLWRITFSPCLSTVACNTFPKCWLGGGWVPNSSHVLLHNAKTPDEKVIHILTSRLFYIFSIVPACTEERKTHEWSEGTRSY